MIFFFYMSFNTNMSAYLSKLNGFKRTVLVLSLKAYFFNNPTGMFLLCSCVYKCTRGVDG